MKLGLLMHKKGFGKTAIVCTVAMKDYGITFKVILIDKKEVLVS